MRGCGFETHFLQKYFTNSIDSTELICRKNSIHTYSIPLWLYSRFYFALALNSRAESALILCLTMDFQIQASRINYLIPFPEQVAAIVRGCYAPGQLEGLNSSAGCRRWTNPDDGYTALYCFCADDLCNSAFTLQPVASNCHPFILYVLVTIAMNQLVVFWNSHVDLNSVFSGNLKLWPVSVYSVFCDKCFTLGNHRCNLQKDFEIWKLIFRLFNLFIPCWTSPFLSIFPPTFFIPFWLILSRVGKCSNRRVIF